MIYTALASVGLLATTALAQGSAIVINKCNYDVHLCNTPSADGVHSEVNQVLSSGGSYSQQYTQLANNNGWSLKLSQSDSFGSDILQYEYTYHSSEKVVWFDLSEVNGNPWDGNWEITATGSCSPRQAAYRFSTDDAYGMQDCPVDSSITVTLCSGTSSGSSEPPTSEPPASPSSPAESPVPTSAPAPAPSTTAGGYPPWQSYGGFANKEVAGAAGDAIKEKKLPKPTTLVTSSVDAWTGPAVTITNLHYETVTQVVTATAHPKRHVHHPRHPHHHA